MPRLPPSPFLFGIWAAALAARRTAALLEGALDARPDPADEAPAPPEWATANTVRLDLPALRLRDFSLRSDGPATLVCAPYALHDATIADFAPGHSLVEAMRQHGLGRVHVTDWKSATADMRFFSIDTLLADLNVAVDDLGPPVDLVGLCQGGWMALVYAARFPGKVRRLVLAAGPIDLAAADSPLSRLARETPLAVFEELVAMGGGRVIGAHMLERWGRALSLHDIETVLQVSADRDTAGWPALTERFLRWYERTLDLPGTYYLEVVRSLYKENRLATGRFAALGRTIDLADVRIPIALLVGRDDELVASEQVVAVRALVGTPAAEIEVIVEPCGHLALFLGARTLSGSWRRIIDWLGEGADRPARRPPRARPTRPAPP